LQKFAAIVYGGSQETIRPNFREREAFTDFAAPAALQTLLNKQGKQRILILTGKGGVGKTVAAAALARQASFAGKTLLVTTDPAAHVGQVLEAAVGHVPAKISGTLWAANIDQKKAADEYKAHILADARARQYGEELLHSLQEELDSPCTEEIAVFEKFAAYLNDPAWDFIVLDTAPTGHTLRLLELPFDYQQQLDLKLKGQESAPSAQSQEVGRVIQKLKDPQTTCFLLVAYPEFTPLHESRRATADLERVGIPMQGVLLNQVLRQQDCPEGFALQRWQLQQHYLQEARRLFSGPLFAMPMLQEEIIGLEAVDQLRRAIFQLPSEEELVSAFSGKTVRNILH
jgi:arsenite/tail-anchored protein-transporting ATPase